VVYKKLKVNVVKILRELFRRKGLKIIEAECQPGYIQHICKDTTKMHYIGGNRLSKE